MSQKSKTKLVDYRYLCLSVLWITVVPVLLVCVRATLTIHFAYRSLCERWIHRSRWNKIDRLHRSIDRAQYNCWVQSVDLRDPWIGLRNLWIPRSSRHPWIAQVSLAQSMDFLYDAIHFASNPSLAQTYYILTDWQPPQTSTIDGREYLTYYCRRPNSVEHSVTACSCRKITIIGHVHFVPG